VIFAGTWQSTVSAIAEAVAALGVAAVFGAALWARSQVKELKSQVRESIITRQASVMLEFETLWRENKLTEARMESGQLTAEQLRDRVKAAREEDENDESYYKYLVEPDFFESLAVLVRSRCVDFEIVNELYGVILVDEWQQWEPTVVYLRLKGVNSYGPAFGNSIYRNFEALAKDAREVD
jgi:hypothetical protein